MSAYDTALDIIEAFQPDLSSLEEIISKVMDILDYRDGLTMTIVYFVGFFEGNAFVAPIGEGEVALCLPVEQGKASDAVLISHECTHVVHQALNGSNGQWGRSVAELILSEGLAMRVSQELYGGQKDEAYMEHRTGWLQSILPYRRPIFQQIEVDLDKEDSDTLFRYTMGTGNLNFEREAYLVGWFLVAYLRRKGYTYAQLARLVAPELPNLIRQAIVDYLNEEEKTI